MNRRVIGRTRVVKNEYYLNIARVVSSRGTCLRRNYGAVIVNNDRIISTGYTGSPRNTDNCINSMSCVRNELNIPSGERYELCKSVHAEMNAIIHASYEDMNGATLYLAGYECNDKEVEFAKPCALCWKMIKNSGIKYVISYNHKDQKISSIDVNNVTIDEIVNLLK